MSLKRELNYILDQNKIFLENSLSEYDTKMMAIMLEDEIDYDAIIDCCKKAKSIKSKHKECTYTIQLLNDRKLRHQVIDIIENEYQE